MAKPSDLRGWSIRWGVVPGTFFLAPPRGNDTYPAWLEKWCEVDSNLTIAQASQQGGYNRVFIADDAWENEVDRLIYVIDNHSTMIPEKAQLHMFLHIKDKWTRTKHIKNSEVDFLLELLAELNNDELH